MYSFHIRFLEKQKRYILANSVIRYGSDVFYFLLCPIGPCFKEEMSGLVFVISMMMRL